MARDGQVGSDSKKELENSLSEKDAPTSRRSVLQAAGLLAGGMMATGLSSGATSDYETITVGAGETKSIDVGDGETLENVLIDVTEPGAFVQIHARGSDWTVRNVGIKGQITDMDNEHATVIIPSVDEGSTGLIENLYMGDGTDGPNNITGMWVSALGHEGELTIRNANVGNWADNGIYASNPGVHDYQGQEGGLGEVYIEDSYAHDNNISGFRIGTPGSYVKNSVVDNNGEAPPLSNGAVNARGIWAKERDGLEAIGCDIRTNDGGVVATDGGGIALEDCRVDAELVAYGGGSIDGSSVGAPDLTPPAGVPMTAEEAASGGSTSGGDTTDDGGSTVDGDSSTQSSQALTIDTEVGGPLVEYEFTVDGSVAAGDAAEANDTITDNGDGTTTVDGVTGNGYTDTFEVTGSIVDWSASVDAEHYRVLLDGTEIDPTDTSGSENSEDRSLVVGTYEGGPLVEYEVTIDGTASKGETAESSDSIPESGDGTTTIVAATGNGYQDDYVFSGEVTGVTANVDAEHYQVLVDGEEYTSSDGGDSVSDRPLVVDTQEGGPLVEYEFTVDGSVTAGNAAEGTDTITDNGDGTTTVDGVTGNGYTDSYVVRGTLTDWSASVDAEHYRVLLDESEIDVSGL